MFHDYAGTFWAGSWAKLQLWCFGGVIGSSCKRLVRADPLPPFPPSHDRPAHCGAQRVVALHEPPCTLTNLSRTAACGPGRLRSGQVASCQGRQDIVHGSTAIAREHWTLRRTTKAPCGTFEAASLSPRASGHSCMRRINVVPTSPLQTPLPVGQTVGSRARYTSR